MGSTAAGALFLLLIAVVPAVLATTYHVGDAAGWTTGVDYTTWLEGKTFMVGDTLKFSYDSSHSVSEVSATGYDSCDDTRAMQNDSGGKTKIIPTTPGMKYIICTTPHAACLSGMKIAIDVLAAASSPGLSSLKES